VFIIAFFFLFAFGRCSCRAVLENGSAIKAQIQLSLPQTAFNLVGVRDVVAAKPKGIGCARGSLLRRSTVFGNSSRIADASCDQGGRDKFTVRHIHLFLISLIDCRLADTFAEREHGLVNVVA